MKKLSPRQLSGFVMLVNTFLPAIVIVVLGIMIVSTSSTLREELCAVEDALDKVKIDERGYPEPSIKELIKKSSRPLDPREDDAPTCELFKAINAVFYEQLVTQTKNALHTQFATLQTKIDALGRAIGKSVSMKLEAPEGADLAVQGAIKQFNKRLAGPIAVPIKSGLNKVRKLTYDVFQPQTENIVRELRKVHHKQQVVRERVKVIYAAQVTKFQWFFIALATWLVLSYVAWVHRRLLVVKRLLRNEDSL